MVTQEEYDTMEPGQEVEVTARALGVFGERGIVDGTFRGAVFVRLVAYRADTEALGSEPYPFYMHELTLCKQKPEAEEVVETHTTGNVVYKALLGFRTWLSQILKAKKGI